MKSESQTNNASTAVLAQVMQGLAGALFFLLLAGYMIFNRSCAMIGFPPVYIGEMVLGLALLAALFDFRNVFIEPLKRSRAMQCVAVFMFYGIVRILMNLPSRGLDAARDGVICLYAVAAFLGPWLLNGLTPFAQAITSIRPATPDDAPSANVRNFLRFLTIVSVPALAWAWGIHEGWLPSAAADVKVDFLALSAAVACAVWTGHLTFWGMRGSGADMQRRKGTRLRGRDERAIAAGAFTSLALWSSSSVALLSLPTRAIQPAILIFPISALFLGYSTPSSRKRFVLFAIVLIALLGVFAVSEFYVRGPAAIEKVEALTDPDDSHFKTREGQRAAHSVKWRIVFWKRCIRQTFERAPVFGLGFGTNLTDLMRGTPDWPMFEDSQNAAKYGAPNRHPHSAHVAVFARLGASGFAVWIALLAATLAAGCRNIREFSIWRHPSTLREWVALDSFLKENALLSVWLIYLLAMSFGVVLENPFGGIWFWTLTGMIANRQAESARGL